MKKKKYPPIEPRFSEDKKTVYLDLNAFQSIIDEAQELREKIKLLDAKEKKKLNRS